MSETNPLFEKDHATEYDARTDRLAPIKDALHLMSEQLLRDLPGDARLLCVGAGTGAEIDYFAGVFPGWHFVAVDPAADMMEICERKAHEGGYAERCTFHSGSTNTLQDIPLCDVATTFLVSQFFAKSADRIGFFREIARRLKPGAALLNVDLVTVQTGVAYDQLVSQWIDMANRAGMPLTRDGFENSVSMITPDALNDILRAAGFERPQAYFQALLMLGVVAQTAVEKRKAS